MEVCIARSLAHDNLRIRPRIYPQSSNYMEEDIFPTYGFVVLGVSFVVLSP